MMIYSSPYPVSGALICMQGLIAMQPILPASSDISAIFLMMIYSSPYPVSGALICMQGLIAMQPILPASSDISAIFTRHGPSPSCSRRVDLSRRSLNLKYDDHRCFPKDTYQIARRLKSHSKIC